MVTLGALTVSYLQKTVFCRRGFTLQEALDMAYDESENGTYVDAIYMVPPDPSVLTDEDFADEDDGGVIDNLSRRQLSSQAEIILSNNERIDEIRAKEASSTQTLAVEKQISTILAKDKRKGPKNVGKNWISGDLQYIEKYFPTPKYAQFEEFSPAEMFELFIDDVISLFVEESNKYAKFLNCPDPNISSDEIKCTLGILLFSGYVNLPGKRYFWDSGTDTQNILVREAMRRNRFLQILRFLHCVDNTKMDPADKLWKLRPLITKLQDNFSKYSVPTKHMNYDESMVKYYGRHSCKQFIRGKPIRFGYKVWCLNDELSYLHNFEVYQGQGPKCNILYNSKFGSSAAPFVQMVDALPQPNLRYEFFLDNLFIGFDLLTHMNNLGYGVTGTIRENRIPRDCPLPKKEKMKKAQRGSFENQLNKDDGIILIRWIDNSIVTMASTSYGVQPTSTVSRYSQAEKKKISISSPYAIRQYNKFMGGTDHMDEDIARRRISIRSKKWYWPLLTWMIDAACHNAWVLYKSSGRPNTNLDFRRSIVSSYLMKYRSEPCTLGRPSSSSFLKSKKIKADSRFDRMDYLVCSVPNNKRRRCAMDNCSSVGRTQCKKCDVGLCINCFEAYHRKN